MISRKCLPSVFNNCVFPSISFKSLATEATIGIPTFKLYNIDDDGPALSAKLTAKDGLAYYRTMQVIRRMEATLASMYQAKQVRGFLHLYAGQEAISTGMKAQMRDKDSIVTGYRCHAWCLLMGSTVHNILAELCGKKTGTSQGKGGSMHLYGKNFYGGHGIVGAQVPIGVGVAFAHKYKNQDNVCITCYGDGAANQGQIFESYNMAKLWNLPVIFVCENNQYAMGTSRQRGAANPEFFTRCEYIPGIWVEASDVLAVREVTRYSMDRISKGKGPIILEMYTYRYYGHSMADPGTSYRTRDEVKDVRAKKDPIELLKQTLLGNQLATAEQLKKIDSEVKKENEEASKLASQDQEPSLDQIGADVQVNPLVSTAKGIAPWDTMKLHNTKQPVNT